jgi:hypothetical protein
MLALARFRARHPRQILRISRAFRTLTFLTRRARPGTLGAEAWLASWHQRTTRLKVKLVEDRGALPKLFDPPSRAALRAPFVEGEVARLGAIAAALSAGEPLRAVQLGERYPADTFSASARRTLAALLSEANEQLERDLARLPNVEPTRFKLRGA